MQIIERDVLVDPNESGDYWYIPLTFYDANGNILNDTSEYGYTITAVTWDTTTGNYTEVYSSVSSTDWECVYSDSPIELLCALKIPKSTTFTQILCVSVVLQYNGSVVTSITLNIRKAIVGSGGSSGSGSSSSISVPTAPEIAAAVWNYYVEEPSSGVVGTRTLSSVSDIAQAVWNYSVAEPTSGVVGTRTLSTTVEVNPSAIAEAVWNYAVAEPASGTLGTRTLTTAIPTAANIATAVLTTDVSDESVETDEYTLKHLVMASQRSKVVTENGETVWKIMGNRLSGETGEEIVIATRTLTLNANGAITQTM